MERREALRFCERWLPLWTGNRPEALTQIYAENAYYRDPAKPGGVKGRPAILAYFRKLLAAFPDWVWQCDEVFPIDGGFTGRWKAVIPVGDTVIHETGLDLVLIEHDLITVNEVYFDRSALLAAMTGQK